MVWAVSTQGQTLLYDNGPIRGTFAAFEINEGWAVADSFTLAADSTVANATVGIWNNPGDSLSSVQWSITTAPFGGTTLASGTASTTDTFLRASSAPGHVYSVYSDNFSITATELAAGTYWFQLGNVVTAQNTDAYWDANVGPSSASQDYNGSFYQNPQSESFQLYGIITAPEPSTMALVLVGGLSLVCLRRRK